MTEYFLALQHRREKVKARLLFGVMCLALILAAPAAQAATLIYDNGAPDSVAGLEMAAYLPADTFTLATPQTVTDVRFWAFKAVGYGDPDPGVYNGSIVWQIYADSGGQPGITPLATGTVTPVGVYDHNTGQGLSYRYDFSITPQTLSAGTPYWLALHNGSLTEIDTSNFVWETSNESSGLAVFDVPPFSGSWSSVGGYSFAFELYGNPVPLPGAVWLLGSGLLGLIGLRKKLRS
jgi:hypothetical protein